MNTPAAALGSCRYKLKDDDLERIIAIFRRYEIHALLYIGGNDSADTAYPIAQAARPASYDLQAITIPTTIPNGPPLTDHRPSYCSPATFNGLPTRDSTINP